MTIEQLRAAALTALNAAKAIKEEFGSLPMNQWPADRRESFNAALTEFAAKNDALEAEKAAQEQFATLQSAVEKYTVSAEKLNFGAGRGADKADVEKVRQRHAAAFVNYLAYGVMGLSAHEQQAYMTSARDMFGGNAREKLAHYLPEEQLAHLGTIDNLGGFLVPEVVMAGLLSELPGATVMRRMARVTTTTSDHGTFLTVTGSGNAQYSSGVTGSWRGQGWVIGGENPATQDQPRFGRERVPVQIWAPDVIEIPPSLIADSSENLDSKLRELLTETRAQDEDSAFILGSGSGQPRGVLTDVISGSIASVNSGAAGALTYPGLVQFVTSLPAQYRQRSTILLNSMTLGAISTMTDSNGFPIFPSNLILDNLFGRPLAVSEFMPDIAAGSYPMIIGDFSYYGIVDRMDMRIIRLVEKYAPNIGLLAIARVGGQVLKTMPFRAQRVAA